MTSLIRIKGIFLSEGVRKPTCGEIHIIRETNHYVYASWRLMDEHNKLIAGLARRYHVKKGEEIWHLLLNNILKYRIGRKRIFDEIRIIEE